MTRAGLILALTVFCLPALFSSKAWAHLNHVQFATVEESGGKLLLRYRMSADMFMTNLEVLIKNGTMSEDVKRLPLDKLVARYFEKHLLLAGRPAESVSFKFDDKNGDWVADFRFPLDGRGVNLFCDAFLENNPNTQTLARIKYRGEQNVYHFRKGNVNCVLGSSAYKLTKSFTEQLPGGQMQFLNGFAQGLREYTLFFYCILFITLLRKIERTWVAVILFFGFLIAQSSDHVMGMNALQHIGWLLALFIAVITVHQILYNSIPILRRMT